MKMDYFKPAKTAAEQLRRWDAGRSVWSIEMGGLGPGYEQAIQILAIEIVRDNISKPLPIGDATKEWGQSTAERVDAKLPNGNYALGGLSGAQVGAARQLAYRWIEHGPAACLEQVPLDRRIQVSKSFPNGNIVGEPKDAS